MNPIIRNLLAVIAGLMLGSLVNMFIIMISGSIIPPPAGGDISTMEGLKETMHLFQPRHFLFPFLAHALGTFAGAVVTALIAVNNKMKFALGIGVFFLAGGIYSVITLPSPLWYSAVDLIGAYLPPAYLAAIIIQKKQA